MASEIGRSCLAGKVLTAHDTRSQSPQNIYSLLYDIHKVSIENTIIFSGRTTILEDIIFLRVCGGLRGLL